MEQYFWGSENGDILCTEKKEDSEGNRYTSIWNLDGVDGTKEIILENLPAPDTVHIIAGCNDEDIFIRWDHALWEVIGPEEIKLVMRYDDVEALRSGVVDEFRMRDGSWGFLKMVEEQQTLEDEKEYYYTLIRVR